MRIGEPKRIRSKEHLKFVAKQSCLICGRKPAHAHHIRYAQPRALSRKVSDEFRVLLWAIHHDALHRVGDEKQWWKKHSIDPLVVARKLWEERRNGMAEGENKAGAEDIVAATLSTPIEN